MFKLLIAAAAILSAGCTHHTNLQRSESLSTPDHDVYVSSKAWEDGTPRHVVLEEDHGITDGCSDIVVKQFQVAPTGVIVRQSTETRRCGLTVERIDETFDAGAMAWTRSVSLDTDADGVFDAVTVTPGANVASADVVALARLGS